MNEDVEQIADADEEPEIDKIVAYIKTLRAENAALRQRCDLLESPEQLIPVAA
jgi:hypothetical protein